jgi:sulfite exporter TauE/SafE
LAGFLVLGLLGGFGHCVGMCSAFVLFVSRRYAAHDGPAAAFMAQIWYAAGRVATYALLGGVAGALGAVVQSVGAFVGVQRAALVFAGFTLVVWALLALAGRELFPGSGPFVRVMQLLKRRVPGHPFVLGLFLGLLPCGFLYSAVVAATARGTALQGALALVLFGVGTAPALLGVSVADEFVGARRRALLNGLAQLFVLAMGARLLWRALPW